MITCISENKLKKGKLRWENFNFQLRIVNKFTKYCVIILANPHLPTKFKIIIVEKNLLNNCYNTFVPIQKQGTRKQNTDNT